MVAPVTLLFGLISFVRPVISGVVKEGRPSAAVKVEVVRTTLTALTHEVRNVPRPVRIRVRKDTQEEEGEDYGH